MKLRTFYIDNFYIIDDESKIDLGDFQSHKRRLAMADRATVTALDKNYRDDVEEIIFASEFGEFERLDKIIAECEENNEVSPMKFAGSVHNYSIGCYNFVKKLNIPYQALTSGVNSISAGLLKCILSEKKTVLFCYSDCVFEELKCFGVLISKEKKENSIECEFDSSIRKNTDEYRAICDFLNNKTDSFNSIFGSIRKRLK